MLTVSQGTWFRCPVKVAGRDVKTGKGYFYYDMTFFTRCLSGYNTFLCIGAPDQLRAGLERSLSAGRLDFNDPYSMHVPVVDVIIALYKQSAWALRKLIWDIEKVSLRGYADAASSQLRGYRLESHLCYHRLPYASREGKTRHSHFRAFGNCNRDGLRHATPTPQLFYPPIHERYCSQSSLQQKAAVYAVSRPDAPWLEVALGGEP